MMPPTLGDTVALGLLAGPDDFERLRLARQHGLMARLWRQFESALAATAPGSSESPNAADLAFGAAVARRPDWAQRAIEAALQIAHEPISGWIHPEAGCMTLTGMNHAHQLCLVIDWLWPLLNRDQREALVGALIAKSVENLARAPDGLRNEADRRGLLLFARRLDRDDPHCLHPLAAQVNNWDIWFAGGLFMAACLAERAFLTPDASGPNLEWGHYYDTGYMLDAARVARWKAIARERIATAIANQLGPDGDYGEGLSYASYGGCALMIALLALERMDGARDLAPTLAGLPAWARNQFVAEPHGGAANFNDCTIACGLPPFLLAFIAGRSGDPQTQGIALETLEQISGNPGHLTLLAFHPDRPAQPVRLPEAHCFQHTGEVVWRTAQDRSGIFFALQSGAHGGAHQHADRNSFFLSAYGELLAVDTGDGRYAKPAAPDYAGTVSHNAILIDGRGQVGDNAHPVAGRILEQSHEGSRSTLWADATACYEGVTACRRRVVFLRPDLFVLVDHVEGKAAELTWLLQGYHADGAAQWTFDATQATLTRPAARLHVIFGQPIACFALSSGTLDGAHKGILRLAATAAGRQFLAVLVPARAGEEPPVAARDPSGSLTVRFRGATHAIRLEAGRLMIDKTQFKI